MTQAGYKQFCPVAMAAEVLCTRWTMVLIRELVAGTTRFNDLRRGVPKMSPALLSTRLKELELAGIVERRPIRTEKGVFDYHLTNAGRDLRPLVEALGKHLSEDDFERLLRGWAFQPRQWEKVGRIGKS